MVFGLRYVLAGALIFVESGLVLSQTGTNPITDSLGDPLPPGAILRLGTIRWRPSGSIDRMAFSHDGTRMASANAPWYTHDAFSIWDVPTGRELRRVERPGIQFGPLQWLADGRGMCLASTSEGQFIWEFTDDKFELPHKIPTGGDHRIMKIAAGGRRVDNEDYVGHALSPDGRFLAAGKAGVLSAKKRDVVIWDAKPQAKIADLPKPRRLGSVPDNVTSLRFTPDGRKIAVFCQIHDKWANEGRVLNDKRVLVVVLDAESGKELRRFDAPSPPQGDTLALSKRYLAIGVEDEVGTAMIWDLEKNEDRRFKTGHGKKNNTSGYGIASLTFTPDGKSLITGGRDQVIRIWDTSKWESRRTIEDAYPSWIERLAVTRDGKRLACSGQMGHIRHFDLESGKDIEFEVGNRFFVTGVQYSADGTQIVTASEGKVRVWNAVDGELVRRIQTSEAIRAWPGVVLAPDSRTILVSAGEKLSAWNLADGAEVNAFQATDSPRAMRVAFSADGKILIANQWKAVSLLDWPSGKLRRTMTLPEPLQKPGESHCDAAALSPDGRWLATLSHRSWSREERGMRFGYGDDGVVDLWNATTGERTHRLIDGGWGRTALFTANGDLLLDCTGILHPLGARGDVKLSKAFSLIDPLTGQLKQTFEPAPIYPGITHRYNSAIDVTPDGRVVVCTGNDGAIHFYEIATGKIRHSLTGHRSFIAGLSFTNDGRRLATASHDLTALVWDISLAGAERGDVREFTADEQAKLWEQLTSPDAKAGYQAMVQFAARPKNAIAAVRAGIKPAPPGPDEKDLDRLVVELGDEEFKVRELAMRQLDKLGESAVPGMRARLANSLPLETHCRVVQFLERFDPATITPRHLREIRAIEILEQLNDAESRAVLTELAGGARNARLTTAAASALTRTKR